MKVKRGELHDLYIEGGRSAVMVGDEVVVLSEIATSILGSVPESGHALVEAITRAVIEEFGSPDPPNDAGAIIIEQIHDLAAHRILILEDQRAIPPTGTAAPLDVVQAVHGAVGAILSPDQDRRWSLPANVSGDAFLDEVQRQRVDSQIMTRLNRVELPPSVNARLRAQVDGLHLACVQLVKDLFQTLDQLADQGIRVLVVKGLPLAVQAWGDHTARGYGDIDLLVAPRDVTRAYQCLMSNGWNVSPAQPRPGSSWAWRQFLRTDNEGSLYSGRTVVDLHWHLAPYPSSFPDFDQHWIRRSYVDVAGRQVPTLSPYDAMAHSAGHSARDHWRWVRGLADVHRLASQRDTWEGTNRPLRQDQLITLGLAARMFGTNEQAPRIVGTAMKMATVHWNEMLRRQMLSEQPLRSEQRPGQLWGDVLDSMMLTRASATDYARVATRIAVPSWRLAEETSPSAWVAAPRVLGRRLDEVIQRLRTAAPKHQVT